MNSILRMFLFSMFSLWLTAQLFPALVIPNNIQIFLTASLVFTALMLIVKPMLSILFIPLNLITFGLAKLIIPAILLYLLTLLLPTVVVREWTFPGLTFSGFVIPSAHVNYFLALFISGIIILIVNDLLEKVTIS